MPLQFLDFLFEFVFIGYVAIFLIAITLSELTASAFCPVMIFSFLVHKFSELFEFIVTFFSSYLLWNHNLFQQCVLYYWLDSHISISSIGIRFSWYCSQFSVVIRFFFDHLFYDTIWALDTLNLDTLITKEGFFQYWVILIIFIWFPLFNFITYFLTYNEHDEWYPSFIPSVTNVSFFIWIVFLYICIYWMILMNWLVLNYLFLICLLSFYLALNFDFLLSSYFFKTLVIVKSFSTVFSMPKIINLNNFIPFLQILIIFIILWALYLDIVLDIAHWWTTILAYIYKYIVYSCVNSYLFVSDYFLPYFFLIALIVMFAIFTFRWIYWVDVESTVGGRHVRKLKAAISTSFWLFLLSELMLFASLFITYFSILLQRNAELSFQAQPSGFESNTSMGLLIFATVILVCSGYTYNMSYYLFRSNNIVNSLQYLDITLFLAISFLGIQAFEYSESSISMSDSIFGSFFFFITGFHGFHVVVGTLFIYSIRNCIYLNSYNTERTTGFGLSVIYWHFVDIIWIFVVCCIYLL